MSRKDPNRKNKRSKIARKRVLRIRNAIRYDRKIKRQTFLLQEEIRKITNPGITIRNSKAVEPAWPKTSEDTDVLVAI